jgi:hypothetical protein
MLKGVLLYRISPVTIPSATHQDRLILQSPCHSGATPKLGVHTSADHDLAGFVEWGAARLPVPCSRANDAFSAVW